VFFHIRTNDYPVSRRTPEVRAVHRKYLESHAGHLIARGATQSDDGQAVRGSVYFVEFPDRGAAERFIAEEPNNRAGFCMSTEVVRWNNAMQRRAGAYTGKEGQLLWYLRGYAKSGIAARRDAVAKEHREWLHARDADVALRGGILADDETWRGLALIVALPDRKAADAFAAEEPYCANGLFERVLIERCSLAGPEHR
jgi:uncharacterized protein YciI